MKYPSEAAKNRPTPSDTVRQGFYSFGRYRTLSESDTFENQLVNLCPMRPTQKCYPSTEF